MEVSFIGGGNHQPAVKKRMNYLTLPKKQQTMKKKIHRIKYTMEPIYIV
jgi:hypothetical protein